MGILPTYGMAGIGIAAAIGFIFALSILAGNSGIINTSPEQSLQEKTSNVPSGQVAEDSNGSAPMFAKVGEGSSGGPGENLSLNQQEQSSLELGPTLESVVAMDPSTRISDQIVPDMQFESHKPVLIQARFANHNDGLVGNHSISLSIIRGSGVVESDSAETIGQRQVQATIFRGDIGANSSIELDLYWNPDIPGDYTILIFSDTAELASSHAITPATIIPVRVVAAS